MYKEDLEALSCFILAKNPYFRAGFAQVYKDPVTQALYSNNGSDMQAVLPADTLGNYFYLRSEGGIKHEPIPAERLSDSGTQRLSFLDTAALQLVAVVRKADAYILAENLRNTLMQYHLLNAEAVNTNVNREQVMMDELAGMKPADIEASLQRLKDETIVRITLRLTKMFVPGNCIKDPVK